MDSLQVHNLQIEAINSRDAGFEQAGIKVVSHR